MSSPRFIPLLLMLSGISILIGTFGLADKGRAQDRIGTPSRQPILRISKTTREIRIDGRLDEETWQDAEAIDRFTQREPEEGKPSSERTEVRLLYDDDNLYVAFHCWDSEAQKIVANEMRRDTPLGNNDCVEIVLDTYHDHRTAFYFCTNPLGAQRDGIVTTDESEEEQNWDWNGVWENVSRIDSTGWTAEIAIPFKTLRFHEQDDPVWGINFARYIPRKREETFWSPIVRDYGPWGKYRISAYGHLTGLQDIHHPRKLELKPYLLPGMQRDFEKGRSLNWTLNYGLDGKYRITPNLTLDMTWNTDFAQVEADQEQVNLTRFELFFPEKRDFFLEGASIFRFGERPFSPIFPANVLFFSRRIGLSEDNESIPLLGGLKVTGKTGGFNVGVLNMLADRIRYTNEDDEDIVIPRTNFSVLRMTRDVLQNSTVGVMGLNQESLDDGQFNRSVGADANVWISGNLQVSGFVAKTFASDKTGKDVAAYADFLYMDDFWTLMVAQNSIQENFNPEMGFFPRTGIRKTQVNFGVSPRPRFFNIRQISLINDFYYIASQEGVLETRVNYTGFWSLFQNGATLYAFFSQQYERPAEVFEIHDGIFIQPGIYRYNSFVTQFDSDKSKPVSGLLSLTVGRFYDGHILAYGIGTNVKCGPRLTINVLYNRNDVKLSAGNFSTNILGTRILYTFSPRLYAKAYVQWNSDKKAFIGNFLMHFIHTPGSDLYIVYNEELETMGARRGMRTNNRTLLVKLNYLFHL